MIHESQTTMNVSVRTGMTIVVLFYCLTFCGCHPGQSSGPAVEVTERSEVVIRRFCGDCHAFPEPDTYPLALWPEKVREGFHFYHASLRTDLEVPEVDLVEQFYAAAAPEELSISPSQLSAPDQSNSRFVQTRLTELPYQFSAVAQLKAGPQGEQDRLLLISDMQTGNVFQLQANAASQELNQITKVLNACNTQPVDLDQDGELDYVVADLGSFLQKIIIWERSGLSQKTEAVDSFNRSHWSRDWDALQRCKRSILNVMATSIYLSPNSAGETLAEYYCSEIIPLLMVDQRWLSKLWMNDTALSTFR